MAAANSPRKKTSPALVLSRRRMQICFSFFFLVNFTFCHFFFFVDVEKKCSRPHRSLRLIVDIIIRSRLVTPIQIRSVASEWTIQTVGILHFSFLKGMQMQTKWNYSLRPDCWFLLRGKLVRKCTCDVMNCRRNENQESTNFKTKLCVVFPSTFQSSFIIFRVLIISFSLESKSSGWQPFNVGSFQLIVVVVL